ncbi:MAG: hypothetical protein V3V08_17410 [Nannocystaceae bacterium]
MKGYSEADLEGGPIRIAIGSSGRADLYGDGDEDSTVHAEVDGVVNSRGFATSAAIYFFSRQAGDSFGNRQLGSIGAHAQAGYVVAKRFQPVVRYATLRPRGGADNTHEILAGCAVYIHEHSSNWQTEICSTLRETELGEFSADTVARTQLQLSL